MYSIVIFEGAVSAHCCLDFGIRRASISKQNVKEVAHFNNAIQNQRSRLETTSR